MTGAPAAETEDPVGPGRSETAPGGRRGGPVLVLAVVLAVLLAAATAVLAVLLVSDEDGDATDDLRRAAGEFAELFVTYDHEDPDVHRDAVLERSTGAFRGEYEEAFENGLRDLITELGATSRGTLQDVYVTSVESGQALAIAVLDIETDGASGPRTMSDVYIRLTMVSIDGRWLVDDVTDLSFGGTSEVPSSTESTSSTTSIP
jgi:Mce-associated membrane protein